MLEVFELEGRLGSFWQAEVDCELCTQGCNERGEFNEEAQSTTHSLWLHI